MKDAKWILAGVAALWIAGASAQPGPGMGDGRGMGGMGMGGMGMGGMGLGAGGANCRDVADPAACEARRTAAAEARRKANQVCKDVVGPDLRRCIRDVRMAEQDCAASGQPPRCQQVKDAYGKCKSFVGPEMRACMRDELPPPDCSKSADPKRCEAHLKAREACKDKPFGPERRQCMSQQPGFAAPKK